MPWKPPPKKAGGFTPSPMAGGGGGAAAFGQSKFFLKKQSAKAKKIQAIVRTFLVQARIFREHTLKAKMEEIEVINKRKADEIKKIDEEKQVTLQQCPQLVKEEFIKLEKDSEECKVIIEELRAEVEKYKTENTQMEEQNNELKKTNKKLKKETQSMSKGDFKLEVQKTKLEKERVKSEALMKEYKENIFDGMCQCDDTEDNILRCVHQKKVFKKYVKAIMTVMEDRSNGVIYDPLILVGIEAPTTLPHVDFSLATIPIQPDEIEAEMDWEEYEPPRLSVKLTGVNRALLKKLKDMRSSNFKGKKF